MRILTGTWRRLTPRTKLRLLHAWASPAYASTQTRHQTR